MAILIDAPRWPAHGTRFAHLVSDTSLNELHAFAEAAGLPTGAFDHDHYDVPERRHADLVARGAVEVPEQELLRRLRASGLRVRPVARTPKRSAVLPGLTRAWADVLPDRPALGAELLERWREPHRAYHDVRHLAQALAAAEVAGPASRPVRLALWFHDAVYDLRPGEDEDASADLATARLAGVVPEPEVAEVARLVRLTASHTTTADDADGAVVLDADLSILGQPPGRYHVYVRDVRSEYQHLDDDAFRVGRLQVVERLQALDPLFRTAAGRRAWEATARANLASEAERWSTGRRSPMANR
ncbi:MAG: DUF4031 domain-containing protein [Propionicimonas sp.]|nr:DUF4031 domain-containing protein [Propionicimonas sp.]